MFPRFVRWLRIFLLAASLLTVAALVAGVLFERARRAEFRRTLPSPGASIDIGGRNMNIYCSGEGGPTVVFEPGYGWPGLSWAALQSKISPFTQACWYDRAGTGWSDPGPFPRTDEAIAQDLHALLVAANIHPPYLLTGPRAGGHGMVVFYGLYPAQVAGIVLIDGPLDDIATRPPSYLLYPFNVAIQIFARSDLLRIVGMPLLSHQPPADLSASQRATILTLKRQPEARAADWSAQMMGDASDHPPAGSLGDLPLIVLTPDGAKTPSTLAAASRRGRLIPVASSKQDIAFEAPQAVAGAVAEMVDQLRRTSTQLAPRAGLPERLKSLTGASVSPRPPPLSRKRPEQ